MLEHELDDDSGLACFLSRVGTRGEDGGDCSPFSLSSMSEEVATEMEVSVGPKMPRAEYLAPRGSFMLSVSGGLRERVHGFVSRFGRVGVDRSIGEDIGLGADFLGLRDLVGVCRAA